MAYSHLTSSEAELLAVIANNYGAAVSALTHSVPRLYGAWYAAVLGTSNPYLRKSIPEMVAGIRNHLLGSPAKTHMTASLEELLADIASSGGGPTVSRLTRSTIEMLALIADGGWWKPGALLDADFAGNRMYGGSDFASVFPIVRATVSQTDDASGVYSQDAVNTLRRRDGRGVRIEESRQEGIRNNAGLGAVAPSTFPTNWGGFAASGLTLSIVGTGVENGLKGVYFRLAGTAVGAGNTAVYFETTTGVPCANTQVWSQSVFARISAGSAANVASFQQFINYQTSGGGFSSAPGNQTISLSSTLSRASRTVTIADANAAYIRTGFGINTVAGAVDVTFFVAWSGALQKPYMLAPIDTSGVALTQAADAITINANLNSTIHIEWTELLGAVGTNRTLWSAYVDANNYDILRIGTDNKVHYIVVSGGETSCDLVSTNAVAVNGNYKAAIRRGVNDFALRVSPSLGSPANDNSGNLPVGTPTVKLGSDGSGGSFLNGIVTRIAIQSAQSDAQLAAQVA